MVDASVGVRTSGCRHCVNAAEHFVEKNIKVTYRFCVLSVCINQTGR